ncbi:MAG: hypothetical protein QOG75_6092, partial [Mycobacterium sp.]|nr:hypothetical protein [Mycobacterium sp.]
PRLKATWRPLTVPRRWPAVSSSTTDTMPESRPRPVQRLTKHKNAKTLLNAVRATEIEVMPQWTRIPSPRCWPRW